MVARLRRFRNRGLSTSAGLATVEVMAGNIESQNQETGGNAGKGFLDVLEEQAVLAEPAYRFHDETVAVAASNPLPTVAPPPLGVGAERQPASTRRAGSVFWIEVEKIDPNPHQPRREIPEESLKELADSIREHGILQPLLVSKKEVATERGLDVRYELVAGERRLRAAKFAGLSSVPVVIRERAPSETEKLEWALIENVQREDLNPIERARAFARLVNEFGMLQREVAIRIGKSREYVGNLLRLLSLPEDVQSALASGAISEGHGRAILMVSDLANRHLLFERIRTAALSVRDAELTAKALGSRPRRGRGARQVDPDIRSIRERLEEALGTKVLVEKQGERGKIVFEFYSQEELANILDRIGAPGEEGAV